MQKNRLILFGICLNMAATPSYAADDFSYLISLPLEELMQVKVTVANRFEESFVDAPSSVTVITGSEIERMGVRTLTELFNYVPGFQSYMSPNESNRSLILSRGMADIYGSNLLLMIDGRRINDEYTGGFTYADHLIGLKNIKQVEFIRGPGSALYGSNAFSGVINIITEKNKAVEIKAGSNNAKGIYASSYSDIGSVSIDSWINLYRDDGNAYSGLTDTNNFNLSTQDPRQIIEGKLGLEYKRNSLTFEYMKTELRDFYVARRINNQINKNDTQRISLSVKHDFDLPQRWSGSARLGYMRHDRDQQFLIAPTDVTTLVDTWQQDTSEAQTDFNYLTRSDHQLAFGLYLGYMNIPLAKDNFDGDYVLDESRRTLGVYIQDQFDLLKDLRLTAGLRYDNYSDFGDSINPRLALLYQLQESNSLKFMYGRAFRAPSLGDLYDKETIINIGNLFLDPVTVDTYELAFQHAQGNNSLILTWFYNDYKDFITTRTTPDGNVIADNVYDNITQGLELDVIWRLNTSWSARLGFTHIISSNTEAPSGITFSKPEDLAPKNYGNAIVNYNQQKWNWNINTFWHDGISVLQNTGSAYLLNSKLLYQFTPHWKFGIDIRNLLDDEYATPQIRPLGQDEFSNTIQEMPSRGREFFITAQYQWDKN
jgi:outer membrane receptor for ferrienterochelin and colicin